MIEVQFLNLESIVHNVPVRGFKSPLPNHFALVTAVDEQGKSYNVLVDQLRLHPEYKLINTTREVEFQKEMDELVRPKLAMGEDIRPIIEIDSEPSYYPNQRKPIYQPDYDSVRDALGF